jgi:hypothetical protein
MRRLKTAAISSMDKPSVASRQWPLTSSPQSREDVTQCGAASEFNGRCCVARQSATSLERLAVLLCYEQAPLTNTSPEARAQAIVPQSWPVLHAA